MDGYKKFKDAMAAAGLSHVKIGMKGMFKSSLAKVRDVTSVRPLTAEEQDEEKKAKDAEAAAAQEAANAPKGSKKPATESKVDSSMSYRSPNADKFVPSCVSIRTSPLDTISDLIDFFRCSFNICEENRFALIVDD